MSFTKRLAEADIEVKTTAYRAESFAPDVSIADPPPFIADGELVLFGDRPVVRTGLLELLASDWLEGTLVCPSAHDALAALHASTGALLLDGGSLDAAEVRTAASRHGVPTVLVLDDVRDRGHVELVRGAQAVLALADVDAGTLALALAAARRGLTLLSGDLDPNAANTPSLVDCAGQDRLLQALALVASGLRDAEIAVRMSLSESAARKLVQRAVHRMGARTRSEAIAKAVRDGQLD